MAAWSASSPSHRTGCRIGPMIWFPLHCKVVVGSLRCGRDDDPARETVRSERIADLADFIARIERAQRGGELPEQTDAGVLARFYAAVRRFRPSTARAPQTSTRSWASRAPPGCKISPATLAGSRPARSREQLENGEDGTASDPRCGTAASAERSSKPARPKIFKMDPTTTFNKSHSVPSLGRLVFCQPGGDDGLRETLEVRS